MQNLLKKNFQIKMYGHGQYVDALRDPKLKWKGSSNQRVIDVKKSLDNGEIVLAG